MKGCSRKRSAGTILVLATVSMTALLAMAGLALDVGRTYGVRAKLSAAVDAAALAAASAITEDSNSAKKAAIKYFNANMPLEYLGSSFTLKEEDIVIDFNGNDDVSINVSATADVPTFFLPVIGKELIGVGVSAQTVRRAVDLALVVDNTDSLRGSAIDVITRAKDFVSKFHQKYDRLSLTRYAYGAEQPIKFKTNGRGFELATFEDEIDKFTFNGYTNSSEGMWTALNAHRELDIPASLRVIVFFTDGSPNTFASTFDFEKDGTSFTASGSIRSNDGATGDVAGLWKHDKISEIVDGQADLGITVGDWLVELPDYYDPRKPSGVAYSTEFPLTKIDHPKVHRKITKHDLTFTDNGDLYKTVNRIARNLVEDIAEKARQEGIYVYTLGLGSNLKMPTGPDYEKGEDMLIRMANLPTSDTYDEHQPQGSYCYAVNEAALGPCFEEIRKAVIRLSR